MEGAPCSLSEDEVEMRTNSVRSALSDLINASSIALKEAYDSQKALSAKISTLEQCLGATKELPPPPEFREFNRSIAILKARMDSIRARTAAIRQRMDAIQALAAKSKK